MKWILRYLKGSSEICLCFSGEGLEVKGYVDADLAGDTDSRKSTTGFVYTLGGTAVSWGSCWVCRLKAMCFLLYMAQSSVLINNKDLIPPNTVFGMFIYNSLL